jgi:hypothetical protein
MTQWKIARAYLRALRGWSEDQQAEVVTAYAASHGWAVTVVRESQEGRGAWLRMLRGGRRQHVALLPSLHILAEPESAGKGRPVIDFAAIMSELAQITPLIVDAAAGVTSANPAAFSEAVRKAATRIVKGRPLPRKQARKMAAARWAPGVKRGIVDEWGRDWNAGEFRRYQDVWRSTNYTTDGAALAAVNESLVERKKRDLVIGSTASARRIFGGRRGKR